jgi:hypothetical protein
MEMYLEILLVMYLEIQQDHLQALPMEMNREIHLAHSLHNMNHTVD